MKHLDNLVSNYFDSETLADSTALTVEMSTTATQYALRVDHMM